MFEITHRTNGARLSLRPSSALNAAFLAVLGRALAMHEVLLHAFVFLSNHWHALLTPRTGESLSSFLRFVHTNTAIAAKSINGVIGSVWETDPSIIPVLDDAAQIARLRYILAHGTKENLVRSPLEWPGLTCARALIGSEALAGKWIDRKRRRLLSRNKETPALRSYTTRYPITLTPLPAQERMRPDERIREVGALLEEICAQYSGPFLGVDAVLAQDPNAIPIRSKKSTPPFVHTTSLELEMRYLQALAEFQRGYRIAAKRHACLPPTEWPADAFPPTSRFVCVDKMPSLMAMLAKWES